MPTRTKTLGKRPKTVRKRIVKLAGNTVFSVVFFKRGNGNARTMVCRLGVRKDVKGVGMAYDPAEHNLLTVWDTQKRQYRHIPLENVVCAKIRGRHYIGPLQQRVLDANRKSKKRAART